ncbi:MAG: glycosyltransferase family 9 protein [Desulfobacteraceae bacterium]|nr:glycosyltransferase family 9 protein [Desulfobacteraceae bacterium]
MAAIYAKGGKLIWSRPGNFLLVQLGDLGDVVLSLPAARALRERFPGSRICMIVREKAVGLLDDRPWIDTVFAVAKERRSLARELRHQAVFFSRLRSFGARTAFDLRTDQRGAIAARLSGAPRRASFYAFDGRLWRNRLFTHLVYPHRPRGTYMAEQYLSLLQAYGIDTPHRSPVLPVSKTRRSEARRLLRREGVTTGHGPLVALQPFSLWRYKEWPLHRQAQLARWLVEAVGATVVLLGTERERTRTGVFFRDSVPPPRLFDLTGKTPLPLLPALLAECRLLVGMDSAGLHIAAAVGTATFGIFGPTSPADWAPRGIRHGTVAKKMACQPCRDKGCRGSGASRCLTELGTAEVREALSAHLDRIAVTEPIAAGGPMP